MKTAARRVGVVVNAVGMIVLSAQSALARGDDSADSAPRRNAYYGDLHLYSKYSFSAYYDGIRTGPDEAYRFARGESVTYEGQQVKRTTPPLDFLAVTDQSELIGLFNTLADPKSPFSQSEIGRAIQANDPEVWRRIMDMLLLARSNPLLGVDAAAVRTAGEAAWRSTVEAANRHYRPGSFSTFIGFHWTPFSQGRQLHRNVIFRGDAAPLPFSSIDSLRPEDLWAWLEQCRARGQEAIAIPHNSHLSNGIMFGTTDSEGRAMDRAYAERRSDFEPIVQISSLGQSETHPGLSPSDPWSRFELFGMERMEKPAGSYARDALGRGLQIGVTTGVNPYKFGFIGSSDYQNALSDSAEGAYNGARSPISGSRTIRATSKVPDLWSLQISGAGSLTGIWAEENTRESLFAALRRRETFATTGTRMQLRLFGGWNIDRKLFERGDWVTAAYAAAVPMGSDLKARRDGAAPAFAVWATKDPAGANLDRAQIVKVWIQDGRSVEKIYEVALAGDRKVGAAQAFAPAIGNTVDLSKATYANTIGVERFATVWSDPDFDAAVPAVYYLRVLEIPTPRWSTIAAVKREAPLPENVPAVIQERGWSSPVWFTPAQ